MARDFLAIQGSSVPSERVFSSAGVTDHPRRNRLNSDIFGTLQKLKGAYHDVKSTSCHRVVEVEARALRTFKLQGGESRVSQYRSPADYKSISSVSSSTCRISPSVTGQGNVF